MQILITGGAGFIGSTLADKLLKLSTSFQNNINNKIIIIDNFNDYYSPELKDLNIKHNLANPDYKLYRGDICDRNLVNKIFKNHEINCVIHIAARAGGKTGRESSRESV